jgi:tRNA pseudouridine55 synthase
VHDIALARYEWPRVDLLIRCGKGFYVRSLARDLGSALGTGGHCASIRRTAVGPFTLSMARQLDELPSTLVQDDLLSVDTALRMVDEVAAAAASRVNSP